MSIETYLNSYFKLYANCIAVKGVNRSVICDMARNNYHLIPNTFHQILDLYQGCRISDVLNDFNDDGDADVLCSYFTFLVENDLILLCDEKSELELFPDKYNSWASPYKLDNAIIDVNLDLNEMKDYANIISQLSDINCQNIQFRMYHGISNDNLEIILDICNSIRIKCIELLLRYDSAKGTVYLKNLKRKYLKIASIIVHSTPDISTTVLSDDNIILTSDCISSEKNCGNIRPYYFTVNQSHFLESLEYNTCLNRKISISESGEIKNCPSLSQSYGSIKDTELSQVLDNDIFKKYWTIKKDEIAICKDCEFRHICSDCRAYLVTPDDLYSKPLKCGYDPYTNEWLEWSINPMKEIPLKFYGMQLHKPIRS